MTTPNLPAILPGDERAKSQQDGVDKRADGFTRTLLVADVRGQFGTPNFETRRTAIATLADVHALAPYEPAPEPVSYPAPNADATDVLDGYLLQARRYGRLLGQDRCVVFRSPTIYDVAAIAGVRLSVLLHAQAMEQTLRINDARGKFPWPGLAPGRCAELLDEEHREVQEALASDTLDPAHIVAESVDLSVTAMITAEQHRPGGPSPDRGHTVPGYLRPTQEA